MVDLLQAMEPLGFKRSKTEVVIMCCLLRLQHTSEGSDRVEKNGVKCGYLICINLRHLTTSDSKIFEVS
jgi:hypothetical protein